jgi:hypothetical protein
MAGTSNDLGEGTSKQSFHLPGYGGHIPANRKNPVCIIRHCVYVCVYWVVCFYF